MRRYWHRFSGAAGILGVDRRSVDRQHLHLTGTQLLLKTPIGLLREPGQVVLICYTTINLFMVVGFETLNESGAHY